MITLSGKDVLRADQFTKPEIERVLEVAAKHEKALAAGKTLSALRGNVLATLFFEPSTRTRLS
ncbi:MAG: aspartate carbamoyltransferase, partial [Thermotogota bacterium]